MKKKLLLLFLAVVGVSGLLSWRLAWLVEVKGEQYKKTILSQQGYESESIPYQRGEILDSKGTVLATSVDVYNMVLDCKQINEESTEDGTKKYLEPTVKAVLSCFPDVTEEELRAALSEHADSRYFVLRKQLPYEEIEKFEKLEAKVGKDGEKENPNVQGVWFEKEYRRQYPYGSLASKVIGFTASGNEGIGGLEDYYNETLNGIDGRSYGYLNTDSNYERTVKEPINGRSLVTTLDVNIEKIVEGEIAAFQEEHRDEAQKGDGSKNMGVLVMNPQNGEILAMADSHAYDLNDPFNLFGSYTKEEEAALTEEQRLDALNRIWQNYAITYTYEPGSTAKPFTVATGLELGKVRESYVCDGFQEIGGYTIHCVQRNGHGTITPREAIMESCNDAMMQIAADIGKEDFYKFQNIFNFGLRTGIDLPGEARTDTLVYTVENTNSTSLATNSFGQNFNVTMVQLASAFSSLINGGYYYRPHLVKQIVDDSGNLVKEIGATALKQTVSRQTSDTLRDYLYSTVSEGTGKSAKVPGYSMGGKTGTAEKGKRSDKKYVVSFIGFAPVDDPQVLVYVVVDEANVVQEQQSSALATGVAQKIFAKILPYLNIFKDEPETAEGSEAGEPATAEGAGEGAAAEGTEAGEAAAEGTENGDAAAEGTEAGDAAAEGAEAGDAAAEGAEGAGEGAAAEGTENGDAAAEGGEASDAAGAEGSEAGDAAAEGTEAGDAAGAEGGEVGDAAAEGTEAGDAAAEGGEAGDAAAEGSEAGDAGAEGTENGAAAEAGGPEYPAGGVPDIMP